MRVGALDETGQEKQGTGNCRRQAPVHGLRGPCGGRHQHGAPVLRAGEDGARADIGARRSGSRGGAGQGPGEIPGHGPAPGSPVPHQGTAGHRHPRRTPTPTGCRSTSSAGTRSTAAARSCGSTWRSRGRRTCCAVASSFMVTLAAGTRMTCADAVKKLLGGKGKAGGRSARARPAGVGADSSVQNPDVILCQSLAAQCGACDPGHLVASRWWLGARGSGRFGPCRG